MSAAHVTAYIVLTDDAKLLRDARMRAASRPALRGFDRLVRHASRRAVYLVFASGSDCASLRVVRRAAAVPIWAVTALPAPPRRTTAPARSRTAGSKGR